MIPKTNLNLLLSLIIICCLSIGNAYAQCDVKFTDDGGLDNPYLASTDTTYTFCPDVAGDVVTVAFTFVDLESSGFTVTGCYDFLSIYSGSDTSVPLQAVACGELDGDGGTPAVPENLLQAGDLFTSVSVDGCLTVTFTSDSSIQGEGWVADVSCAPPPACVAPLGLSVSNITESTADLAWASGETSFDIEWGPAGFTPGSGTTASGVGNPYALSGLTASTAYDYYVCALCDDGAGGISLSDCTGPQTFTTEDAPPACGGFFFDSGGPDGGYDASANESYTICPDVTGDVVTITFTFVDLETSTAAGIQSGCFDFLSIYSGSDTSTPLQSTACGELDGDGSIPSDAASLLQAGDFFTSQSTDGCLTVTFSSDSSVQQGGWAADVTCAPPADCPPPSGLTVSNIGGNSAELSWTSSETTFNIEYDTTGFTPGTGTMVNGVSNPYTLTGLTPETSYEYYICAICDDGAGGTIISNCTGPQTFTTDVACPAPTALAVANETQTSADLSWTSVETTFDIEWGAVGFTPGMGTTVNSVGNPHTLSGLTNGTAYEYYVCAACDDGMGGTISSQCTGPFAFVTTVPAPTCTSGLFFDNGGPAESYTSNSNDSITICPEVAGDAVTVTFTFVDIETTTGIGSQGGCWDFLSIYNGSDTADTLQMTACGELDGDGNTPSIPESLLQAGDSFTSTAADGCLTFTFSSDGSAQEQGWEATITCAPSTADVIGCTDPCATNYNPAATTDDDSCTLPEEPATACYETATFNTTTCMWDITGDMPTVDDDCEFTDDSFDEANCIAVNTPNCPTGTTYDATNCACLTDQIPGCTDATACNYNPDATTDDMTCVFATGCDTCAANGEVMDNPEVGETCDDGSDNTENDTIQSDCTCAGTPIQGIGCMDATACNYDPTATVDDGTCTFSGDACNDNNPFTFNDVVQANCSCEGIEDGGGVPTVGEWGLIILALILLNLGILYIRQTEMRIEKI